MDNIAGINPTWAVSQEVRSAAEAFLRGTTLRPVGNGAGTLCVSRDGLYFSVTFDPSGKIVSTTSS